MVSHDPYQQTTFQPGLDSLVDLTRMLVRERSCVGTPSGSEKVLGIADDWLRTRGIATTPLSSRQRMLGLYSSVEGRSPGPTLVLNACADTAPIGPVEKWDRPPTAAEQSGGWMWGRGTADSKAAMSVFCHVLRHFHDVGLSRGVLMAMFDGDEHTGRFRGAKEFLSQHGTPDGVMIGYPGMDAVRDGARGFWRATIRCSATGGHSGSGAAPSPGTAFDGRRPLGNGFRASQSPGSSNAVVDAASLALALEAAPLPERDNTLGLAPKITITRISGGAGFSTVPAVCTMNVDCRLTFDFTAEDAREMVRQIIETTPGIDSAVSVHEIGTWPAYRLARGHGLVGALTAAADEAL